MTVDQRGDTSPPTVLSFGGGVNSTALLVGLVEASTPPDLVLFADTGAELPETYAHVTAVSRWLNECGFSPIVTVRYKRTLEDLCLERKMLPSLAYGRRACSQKHKRQPQDAYIRKWQPAIDAWATRTKVRRLLGIAFDEAHRMFFDHSSKRWSYEYPLVDWKWTRADCVEAIKRAGLSVPPKSACFFCPATKKREILALRRDHSDLLRRALDIESNAETTHVRGLGRNFAWGDFLKADEAQGRLFDDGLSIPCVCFDGGDA